MSSVFTTIDKFIDGYLDKFTETVQTMMTTEVKSVLLTGIYQITRLHYLRYVQCIFKPQQETKMKLTKSVLLIALAGITLNSNFAAAGGIPVIDGAHISTNVQNQVQSWALEAKRWTERVTQFQQDFENQTKQLGAMTGVRDIAGFMNEAGSILEQIKDLDRWLGKSNEILSSGKGILSSDLRRIFDSYGLTNRCNTLADTQKKLCEGEIILDVVKQKQNEKKLKVVKQRINNIKSIAKRMQTAKDTKEAQDLSNAMQTQIALLQADKLQADLEKSTEELNQRLVDKKKHDAMIKEMQNDKRSRNIWN